MRRTAAALVSAALVAGQPHDGFAQDAMYARR
jgi:hypothetical protein